MSREIKSDFVNVRLTAAGRKFAGEQGQVHVANAHMAYDFVGEGTQRVVRYQWTQTLSRELADGAPMFEIVDEMPADKNSVPEEIAAEETH